MALTLTSTLEDAARGAAGGMVLGPLGALGGGVLAAVMDLAPVLAGHLVGENAVAVQSAALKAVTSVVGVAPAVAADITGLAGDKLSDVKIALAQIAATTSQAAQNSLLATLKAAVEDAEDARAHDLAVRGMAGGHNYRGDVLLGATGLGLIACVLAAATGSLGTGAAFGLVSSIGGMLVSCWKDGFSFEFSSSRSSERKTEIIAEQGRTTLPIADVARLTRPLLPAPLA